MQSGVFVVRHNLTQLRDETARKFREAGETEREIATNLASLDSGIALVGAIYAEVEQMGGE